VAYALLWLMVAAQSGMLDGWTRIEFSRPPETSNTCAVADEQRVIMVALMGSRCECAMDTDKHNRESSTTMIQQMIRPQRGRSAYSKYAFVSGLPSHTFGVATPVIRYAREGFSLCVACRLAWSARWADVGLQEDYCHG
jgi:hypothetical protein